jgi:hypothetical protein
MIHKDFGKNKEIVSTFLLKITTRNLSYNYVRIQNCSNKFKKLKEEEVRKDKEEVG